MTDDELELVLRVGRDVQAIAFIDILGWGALTSPPITALTGKLNRSVFDRDSNFSEEEILELKRFDERARHAFYLNDQLRLIIGELLEWFNETHLEVEGDEQRKHKLRDIAKSQSTVRFIRFSDNIFLYCRNMRKLLQCVSELMKRALERGLLLRAGVSAGTVFHFDLGTRSDRDTHVGLFGSGVTSSVLSEKVSGTGVRAFVHDELRRLLSSEIQPWVLRSPSKTRNNSWRRYLDFRGHRRRQTKSSYELAWWRSLKTEPVPKGVVSITSPAPTTEWTRTDVEAIISKLEDGAEFAWNRASPAGLAVVEDTVATLKRALEEHEHLGSKFTR